MNKILFLALFVFTVSISFAQVEKPSPLSPEELSLRTALESDKAFQTIGCGLYQPPDPKHPDALLEAKLQKHATRVRLELYRASLKRNKTVKAKINCFADEGGTINYYLIVERGNIRYVNDSSRDAFGGMRVTSYKCDKLIIGYFVPNKNGIGIEYVALTGKKYDDKIIIIQCQAGGTKIIF